RWWRRVAARPRVRRRSLGLRARGAPDAVVRDVPRGARPRHRRHAIGGMTTDAALRRTPLYPEHQQLGARMVPFAGYEMPIQYSGIVAEHRAVREAAGLFDLSHMGEFHFDGAHALAAVDRLVSSDIAGLGVGEARYGLLCNQGGTIVDDVISYRTAVDHVLMVVNAANIEKDEAHVRKHLPKDVAFTDRSAETALIAIQGPRAADILAKVAGGSVAALQPFGGEVHTRGGCRGDDRADRLHGRGRLRGVHRQRRCRAGLAGAPRRGPRRCHRSRRPGRPRHAAARGALLALRERHRRDDRPDR